MKVPNRCLQIVFTKIGSPQLRVGPVPNFLKKYFIFSCNIFIQKVHYYVRGCKKNEERTAEATKAGLRGLLSPYAFSGPQRKRETDAAAVARG